MTKYIALIACLMLALPATAAAGIERLDVSPMILIDLDQNRSIDSESRLLGGALAADWYFTRHFALRTSFGYVRNLYNTSVSRIDRLFGDPVPVAGDSYSLRFSAAPYAEAHLGPGLRPYLTLSINAGYWDTSDEVADIRDVQSATLSNSRYIDSQSPSSGYYDFSGAIGLKVPVFSQFSIFGEVSHRIYSSFDSDGYATYDANYRLVPFGFDQYKTMLSLGMTYSFKITGK